MRKRHVTQRPGPRSINRGLGVQILLEVGAILREVCFCVIQHWLRLDRAYG